KMDEQVSGDTGSIVRPLSPLEESLRIPRNLRCRAQEPWPVARLRAGVRRNRVAPRAHNAGAVPERIHKVQLANRAGVQQFLCLRIKQIADPLTAHLQNPTRL